MRGKIYEESSKHDGGDIERRADVPSEVLGNILENCERRIFRTYKEHIDRSFGSVPKDHVYGECDRAQRKERKSGMKIILSRFCEMSRHDQIDTDKNQQHMPNVRVKRKCPITVRDAGWLDECHNAAEQIIGSHKAVDAVAHGSGLQENRNDTKIHWYTAKLEREDPPNVCVITHIKTIEELFIYFCQREESSDASENDFMTSF